MSQRAIQLLFTSGRVKPPRNGETEEEIFQTLYTRATEAWKEAGSDPNHRPDPAIGRQVAKRIHGMGDKR